MQRTALKSLLAFVLLSAPLTGSAENIRVRIQSGVAKVSLSGLNMRLMGYEEKFTKVAVPQGRKMEISRVAVAGKNYWQISQRASQTPQDVMSSQEVLLVQGENLRQEATELPNKVLLREGRREQIDVIGVVPLEEYVLAVMASEMPLSWPLETLKAQAVAIRSYTMATLRERRDQPFHVESTILDQVYKKISANHQEALLEKARQAVKETEGVYLLNKKGQYLKAFYHSDCGGRTVLASSVWKQETDMDAGVAVDASCPHSPSAKWSLSVPKLRFAELMKKFVGDIRSNEFRALMGFMNLKSTNFEILDREDSVEFVGRGFGHGVGMCQWGSRALGKKGFSYQRILGHYYPLARVKKFENQD